MGIFDLFKNKKQVNDEKVQIIPQNKSNIKINSSHSLVPYFGNLIIPENIRHLLWFGDGIFQNYNPDNDHRGFRKTRFEPQELSLS